VTGVVPDEAELCRHEREEERDQAFQPERLACGDEGHDGHDDQAIHDQDARQRPPWSLLEQSLLLNEFLQLGVRCAIRALSDSLYPRCSGLRHHVALLSTTTHQQADCPACIPARLERATRRDVSARSQYRTIRSHSVLGYAEKAVHALGVALVRA
jgi:hypothetical protein